MDEMQQRRLKPGELKLIRTVLQLHPTVEVELSPADIAYYQSLGKWALVLDRQSHQKELTREEATGQTNRVRNVLTMARDRGLVLPAPQENVDRKEGEFQFAFGEGECRYHWFVDGLEANASGYTASPWARLQLWRAAKIARILRRHGCPPTAVLIGELTRFFRDQKQFMDWYHTLKDSGAQVQIYGCPDLTPETEGMQLPMLLCQTDALSVWLKKQNRMSRETRRRANQLFARRAPFGLQFNLDKQSKGYLREVYPHPIEWPILQRLIHRICQGALTTRAAAMVWFVAEAETCGVEPDRIPRSRSWMSRLLKEEILRGIYVQYSEKYLPCRIEEEAGRGDTDWDYTPNGYRRYVREEDPELAVRFPILLSPEEEIPPADVEQARLLISQKGRPRTPKDQWRHDAYQSSNHQRLLRDGVIRCAICGAKVIERPPRTLTPEGGRHWTRSADLRLVDLLQQGYTNAQIAAELGIKTTRVEKRRSLMKYQGVDFALDMARLERHWGDPFACRMKCWHLYCTCVATTAYQETKSATDVATWSVAQHARKRIGSITLALEPLLWDALLHDTQVDLCSLPAAASGNTAPLEAEAERLAHRISRIQQSYENEDWTLYTPEEARARMAHVRGELAAVQAKIAAAQGSRLDANDHQELVAWEQTRQHLCEMLQNPRFQESWEERRRIVDLCITRVDVDLETGAFEAHTRLHAPSLQRLCGAVLLGAAADVTKDTDPGAACTIDKCFILRGHVRLAA